MEKRCVVCSREFETYDKPKESQNRNHATKSKRPFGSFTCCKYCSKVYCRITRYLRGRYKFIKHESKKES